jgi:hypothetical protein
VLDANRNSVPNPGVRDYCLSLYEFERYQIQETEAVGKDGSAMIHIARKSFALYAIPAKTYDRTRIVLPTGRKTFEVEGTLKEYQELGGLWSFFEHWEDDADCSRRASQEGLPPDAPWPRGPFRRTGSEITIAGVRSIEYGFNDGRISERIALAPSLGCTVVALVRSERNVAGLPILSVQSKLSSVTLAEPDRKLFEIPLRYKKVHNYREHRSIKEWPYIWMDAFHGNTGSWIP